MSQENLILSVEKEIDSIGEYSTIEKLKQSDMDHNKACVLVETVMLYKENYFSRISRLKRGLSEFFLGSTGKDLEKTYKKLCKHLILSKHYESLESINQEVSEYHKSLVNLELKVGYRDDLYYYSSEFKRKIIALINLHYNDFTESMRKNIFDMLGREKLARSIDERAKYILDMVNK